MSGRACVEGLTVFEVVGAEGLRSSSDLVSLPWFTFGDLLFFEPGDLDLARLADSLNQCLRDASCAKNGCWYFLLLFGTYPLVLRSSGLVVTTCNMLLLLDRVYSFGGRFGLVRDELTLRSFSGGRGF